MKQRIITAIVIVLVAIPICIFSDTVVFPIAMALLASIGVYELLGCMKTRGNRFVSIPLYIAALVSPFAARYFGDVVFVHTNKLLLGVLVLVIYLLAIWVFSYQKDQHFDMNSIIASVMISLYVIGAFTSIVFIRDTEHGVFSWYFIFIGAWVTDIFAYFCGMLFGKHKLIPEVSPKKTIEGSIGGTLFCVLFFVGYAAIINHFASADINLWVMAIAGLLSAIVAQIGDLAMSVIKRTYGLKDYGNLFPGHGGVLDRFDSILTVAVVLALFLA